MSGKRIVRLAVVWLVPVVMVLVAVRQHHLARTQYLSPWEGGGFGMFASADLYTARFVRITIKSEDGSVHPGVMPDDISFQRSYQKIQAMPTPDRVRALAVRLAAETWVPADYSPFEPSSSDHADGSIYRCLREGEPAPATDEFPEPRAIEVEVLRRIYDPAAEMVRTESITETEAKIAVP